MWDSYREAFECDGSLRDIYVFNTNLNDWQKFFEFLEEKGYECKLNDRHYTLPLVAQSLFVSPDKESNLLTVNVNEVILCCHFFWVKEMEFDFDPREIVGEMKISGLLDFISGLGLALNKEVVLTPENLSKHPYFRFSPNKGIVDYLSQ